MIKVHKKSTFLFLNQNNCCGYSKEPFQGESQTIVPNMSRPLVKSAYQKIIIIISKPKHMLWVLKRTVSMKQFF